MSNATFHGTTEQLINALRHMAEERPLTVAEKAIASEAAVRLGAPQGETWAEMGLRHSIERAEAVMALEAQGMTQTEAAKVLGMPLVNLNNFVKRNGLTWRVVRQGFQSRDPESLSPYGVNNPPVGERIQ